MIKKIRRNPKDEELLSKLKIEKDIDEGIITYFVLLNGYLIGRAVYNPSIKNKIEYVQINDLYQRKGIASWLYDYIEKDQNIKLKPDYVQTLQGKKFWENRLRKNPSTLEERAISILGPNIKYINKGSESEVYGNEKLVVKVYYRLLSKKYTDRLEILSDAKLIPQIYKIGEDYVIMDRIYGKPLTWKFIETLSKKQKENIFNQIEKLMKKYHNYDLIHGDLENYQNILVDNNLKVYFIDPIPLPINRDMLDYEKHVLNKIKNHLDL